MNNTKNHEKVTVQGGDTLVPVGDSGDRAGQTRPSSDDCTTHELGDQGYALVKTTGEKKTLEEGDQSSKKETGDRAGQTPPSSDVCITHELGNQGYALVKTNGQKKTLEKGVQSSSREETGDRTGQTLPSSDASTMHESGDQGYAMAKTTEEEKTREETAFRPKRSLARTPQKQRERLHSMPDMKDFKSRTTLEQKAKRKRGEVHDSEEDLGGEQTFLKLKEYVNSLETIVSSAYRPSTELKNVTTDIKRQVKLLAEERKENMMKEKIIYLEREMERLRNELLEADRRHVEEINRIRQQTPERSEASTQTTVWNRGKKILMELPDDNKSFENWSKVADIEWDESIFSNVEVIAGNPVNAGDHIKKVILVGDSDEAMTKSIQKIYRERYPELEQLKEDIEVIELSTRDKKKNILSKKTIIKIRHNETEEDLWKKLTLLLEETKDDPEPLALHSVECVTVEKLRKMAQWIFAGERSKIYIYTPQSTTTEQMKKEKPRNSYALIVQCKEGTYRETLKNIRRGLKDLPAADAIQGIRSTKDGKMLITVQKSEEKCKQLTEALGKIEGNINCNVLGKRRGKEILHIRGMDAETSKEEVTRALTETLGDETKDTTHIGELRPSQNETQAITVTVEEGTYEKLLKKGKTKLKIGLANCKIEKRIQLTQCHKCWDYNHKSQNCEGPDRSKMCYKCGQEGHISKTCQNNPYCTLCCEDGHAPGSGKCQIFRKALLLERKRLKNKMPEDRPFIQKESPLEITQRPNTSEAETEPMQE